MLMIRSTALSGYIELAESVGLNPHPLLRVSGIDPSRYASPTGWIPARAVDHLLEISAEQSGHADFGIRMSADRGVSHLGAIGLVAREEPDLRSAVNIILRHLNLHNEAVELRLSEAQGLTIFESVPSPDTFHRQSVEFAVGSMYRILSDLMPADWAPSAIYFSHSAPADVSTHRRLLGDRVIFDHDFNGIVTPTSDLDQPNLLADPLLRPFAQEYLGLLAPAAGLTLAQQVHELIATLLPEAHCSVDRVAHTLNLDRRTMHRRLSATGDSYSSILDQVRSEQATAAILKERSTLTEIATEMGFSELSAFSRWFRQRFGVSPRQWASQQRSPEQSAPEQQTAASTDEIGEGGGRRTS
ncbi:AraC family transcriptional regulator [Gordonia sp. (in: high G+C Gram-positive bacteria)]|uniref:AraC family transcriptional regulator n=1 Tax=Gordonia sp. (in: high G+C Gram-positive bacteria) TaxID=84139 RepID=UPI003C76C0D5